jgi:diadenosine tetraphosphate (Ap4A) HIT family hydrolase
MFVIKSCLFCNPLPYVLENPLSVAFYDKYPVTPGHLIIIPRCHVATYFDLSQEEKRAIDELILKGKAMLDKKYSPDGYNIGINCGSAAGQTIFHCHVHLIPRYKGDVENPRGGVRGAIPNKRIY